MKYLFLKIEIIATSIILAVIVISTAPTKSIALWWDLEFFDAKGEKVGDGEFRYDLNSENAIESQNPLNNESIVLDFTYDYALLPESLFHNAWQLKRVSFQDFVWWQTQFGTNKLRATKPTATLVSIKTIQHQGQILDQSSFSHSTFVELPISIRPTQVATAQPFELDLRPEDQLDKLQEFGGTWTANLREGKLNQLDGTDMPIANPANKEDLLSPEPLAIVSFIMTTLIGLFLKKSSCSE